MRIVGRNLAHDEACDEEGATPRESTCHQPGLVPEVLIDVKTRRDREKDSEENWRSLVRGVCIECIVVIVGHLTRKVFRSA